MNEDYQKYGWASLGYKSYQEYLNSGEWKAKRDWIIECAEGKCQKCGKEKKLVVHHKSYLSCGNEGSEDVIVFCFDCHKKIHEVKNGEDKINR